MRSWSGWMDPNTACTCECASQGARPSGRHSQPIRRQTTCSGLPAPPLAGSPALRCLHIQSRPLSLQRSVVRSTFAVTLFSTVVLLLCVWGGLNDECSSKQCWIFNCSLQAVTTNIVLLKMWFVVSFIFDLFTSLTAGTIYIYIYIILL